MASGHVNRIKRPNTWLHRPMLQNVKKALANSEPSTHGTERTWLSGGGCPVSGVEQKSQFEAVRSPFDPTETSSLTGWGHLSQPPRRKVLGFRHST